MKGHLLGSVIFAFAMMGATATASANLLDFGAFTSDTATGLDWLDLTSSQNRSFVSVSSQFGAGGDFSGWRYATTAEVRAFWADAGLTNGTSDPCSPSACFAAFYPVGVVATFVELIGGNTWAASYGFTGVIGLTSTPYSPPDWPGCSFSPCYLTPEIRLSGQSGEAMVVEALRDNIADPNYASWLVRDTISAVPGSIVGAGLPGLVMALGALIAWRRRRMVAA